MSQDDIVVGIDLGTRNSCISVWKNHQSIIIPDQYGNRTMPSIVSFYRSTKLVGSNAVNLKEVDRENTIYDVKRVLGRKMSDVELQKITSLIPYQLVDDETENHHVLIKLNDENGSVLRKKIYKPEEITSFILLELKKMAETYLETHVSKAVITVPAYFNDSQRQATMDSSRIAGLEVIKIINEPTAAALAYGIGSSRWVEGENKILIYDLGAGTLDISLIEVTGGEFKTLAVGGNMHLGGEDFDFLLMNHIINNFRRTHKIKELLLSQLMRIKLKNMVERAKKVLSSSDKFLIYLENFYQNLPLHFSLTRKDFENICHDLFVLCLGPLHDIFQYTHINPGEIKEIVLVGGSTRIPKIQKMILEYFKPYGIEKLTCNLNPDEVVSIGASIYGYVMTHQEDPYTSNVVLLDIMPLSIGVETLQRQMSVIIPRNSTIPVKKTKYFSTDTDNEESVQIKVFEGERKLTKHNFHVGTFTLHGLPKGPRGFPVIRITFEIDINGILHISASEKKSGAQTQIDLKSWTSSKLSTEEINCLIEEAQRNEHIDVICSMKVGLIHKIISLSESILYGLKDPDLNLTKVDKRKIKTDIKNTLQWVKNREMNDLELKELEKCHQRISQLYAPLIILEKKTEKGYDVVPGNMAEVEGDDEETEYLNQYEKVVHEIDPSEYDKEEIKDLKKIIFDLGKNITSIINNPVSHLQPEDIEKITDYIGSINIWLYTNSSLSTTDYVAKIREINQFTEDILQNYHQDNIFEKDENFTIKDELHLICLTLSTSIQSNFFSLEKNDINLLQEKIENTLKWLEENPDKSYKDYADRLDEINCLCNQFYHQTQTLTLPNEREDTAESDEECEKMVELKNTMLDKIDRMINSLPNHMGEIGENMASEDIQPPREGLAIMC